MSEPYDPNEVIAAISLPDHINKILDSVLLHLPRELRNAKVKELKAALQRIPREERDMIAANVFSGFVEKQAKEVE